MKQAVITGATSGIGKETAANLLRQGIQVLLLARNASKADQVCQELHHATANPSVDYLQVDLAEMKQVQEIIGAIQKKVTGIDILINNAGLMTLNREESPDGIELVMAVNHLAVMILTEGLLGTMRERSRIVMLNSVAHRAGKWTGDLNLKEGWSVARSYGNSKLANLMYAYHLARELRSKMITVNAVHPGVVGSGFGQQWGGFMKYGWKVAKPFMLTSAQGAKYPSHLALSEEVEGISAKYFKKGKMVQSSSDSYNQEISKEVLLESRKLIDEILA
ncbi:SDR family NAD(P)-dependent oxidoreductase [bacterium SCSIO 12741]|nr:SDR family NAD(P)-dependent oxidoreductase [bacterium SCSIO 12741]